MPLWSVEHNTVAPTFVVFSCLSRCFLSPAPVLGQGTTLKNPKLNMYVL
jgi:hypothetical protein